jgi:hypothetical protein
MAAALENLEGLDLDALSAMLDVVKAEPERTLLAIEVARVRSDWETVEKEARTCIARFPSWYSAYEALGRALWRKGDKAGARPYFETYVKYCHDEPEWWAIRDLLTQVDSVSAPVKSDHQFDVPK